MTHPRRFAVAVLGALAAATLAASPASADPPTPTQLTASVDATEVDAGQSVTLSGRLTKDSASGPVGVPGGYIGIRACADTACTQVWGGASTTSGPGGYFLAQFAPPRSAYLYLYFSPSWPGQGDLAGTSTLTPRVGVLQLTSHSTISATREPDGRVKFYGSIGFPSRVLPPTAPVLRVEYSPDAATWTTVATVTSQYFHNAHYVYTAYVAEPNAGYWRGVFDGQPAAAKASATGAAYVS
ncbi:hypothetical protein [Saccharothrix xinjiangensis]|uniref:Neocarzinostatin family protein n=1 Tax=Saccharothrix xinjiangensis TaxID=204798 RepID=A0ABV9Y8Q1_9PSEU